MKHCVSHFCTAVNVAPENGKIPMSIAGYQFSYHSRLENMPPEFLRLAEASEDYFLQKDYLELLETCPPPGMHFGYLLFSCHGEACGIAYCQLLEFRADDQIRREEQPTYPLKTWVASQLKFPVLLCGNMLLTGQHGYYFSPAAEKHAAPLLEEALEKVSRLLHYKGNKPGGLLVKDIPQMDQDAIRSWERTAFRRLSFQPKMVLSIPARWECMEDYLEDLNSKYRVRYRRAEKKLGKIRCHELNSRQVLAYEPELYDLYKNVADSSEFCMTYLHPNYFSELKSRNPDNFRLWGYFLEDRLIGFCTSIKNGDELEAHFLGLDKALHKRHQLYLNMLFHLVETAIEYKVSRLILSRTALTIKSSIGAQPEPASVYMKHPDNRLVNLSIPFLVKLLQPNDHWEVRHPFKESSTEEMAGKPAPNDR